MSVEARCETCRYFHYDTYRATDDTLRLRTHECRRHAPTVYFVDRNPDDRGPASAWPMTNPDDWCGEYEPQELRSSASGRIPGIHFPSEVV